MPNANKRQLVAVAIPLYKEQPDANELASLKQAIKVLNKYPLIFFVPESLNMAFYEAYCAGKINYKIKRFNNKYFTSIAGYNQLMLSKRLYQAFSDFEYVLFYQLDAWVFHDELAMWCQQGFDYVGAPWFSSDNPPNALPHFIGVGNGGFSLRRISSHLKILTKFSYLVSPAYLFNRFLNNISIKTFKKLIKGFTLDNNTHYLLGKNGLYEDVFWNLAVKKYSWFKAPDMLTASRFSVETNAEKLYQFNNSQLPFGCHAWAAYEPEFWARHIHVTTDIAHPLIKNAG